MDIKETEWRSHSNQLLEFKYLWACKNGKCFCVTVFRGPTFFMMPTSKNSTLEFEENPIDDYEEGLRKLEDWYAQM